MDLNLVDVIPGIQKKEEKPYLYDFEFSRCYPWNSEEKGEKVFIRFQI